MKANTVPLSDYTALQQKWQQEKDRSDFLNDSCKKYLLAYEKTKRELDRLLTENERLKVRINEQKEISIAKEANFEMVSHLSSLDQEFYQGTIEKLSQELVLIKEDNKLLKELSESNLNESKRHLLTMMKERQEQILMQNTHLIFKNEALRNELSKQSLDLKEITEKYNELMGKQLDQAKVFVFKDEEIRFWKCTLIELACSEFLNDYTREAELASIIDSPLDLSEKFLRLKEKLTSLKGI